MKTFQGAYPTDTYPARYDLPRHNNEAHSNGPDCSENCWRIETKLGNLKNTSVFQQFFSHFFRLLFFCSLVENAKTTYTLLPSWPIHYGKHVGIGHCETNKFQYVLENLGLFLLLSKEFLSFPLQYIDPQNNIVQLCSVQDVFI